VEHPDHRRRTGVSPSARARLAGHLEQAERPDRPAWQRRCGTTHIRIANSPNDIFAVRIAAGEADLVLGCDMVVVNDYWALSKVRAGRTRVVLNSYEAMPGTFTTRPDMQPRSTSSRRSPSRSVGMPARGRRDPARDRAARRRDHVEPVHPHAWRGLAPLASSRSCARSSSTALRSR
jgi:hypothetical protein